MSLIAFHRFLISTAILFCLGFAARQFSDFKTMGESRSLILAIGFGIAGLALGYYLMHLRDFLKIPAQGTGLRPDAAAARPGRSGDGHNRSREWATPLSTPEISSKKGNGRDEQDLRA